MPQKITTCLWFESAAEEAAQFYVSIFKNAKITDVSRFGDAAPAGMQNQVMSVSFTLEGQEFMALNGNTQRSFTEATSQLVSCESQAEVDALWSKLSDGGRPIQCGWLQDKFGVCWQIVPSLLHKLLTDPDPKKSQRVMQAMMQMVKLESAALQRAYDGA